MARDNSEDWNGGKLASTDKEAAVPTWPSESKWSNTASNLAM
jgi:hypothetical protein